MTRCKELDKSVLRVVCILILIDHYISESALIILEYVLLGFEESDSIENKIVKIHGICVSEFFLIE